VTAKRRLPNLAPPVVVQKPRESRRGAQLKTLGALLAARSTPQRRN
jgi:hypothetical protein